MTFVYTLHVLSFYTLQILLFVDLQLSNQTHRLNRNTTLLIKKTNTL